MPKNTSNLGILGVHAGADVNNANIAARQMAASLFTKVNSRPRPVSSDLPTIWQTCLSGVTYVRPV
jgi:hypothetical protein